MNQVTGTKLDAGKPRWDLLPFDSVREIVNVLTFGAKKYAPHNWQHVENARDRYFRATIGHLVDWYGGEHLDQESGLPHLAHAGCNVLFLLWFDAQAKKNEEPK